ncbi:hypothetical protein FACS1894189_3700 [Planctomycetales bacterium]|nr:hypothetical protein FACS1894189_3700 [Planctomycetales bacterium]
MNLGGINFQNSEETTRKGRSKDFDCNAINPIQFSDGKPLSSTSQPIPNERLAWELVDGCSLAHPRWREVEILDECGDYKDMEKMQENEIY